MSALYMNSGSILTAHDRNHGVDLYPYPFPLQTEINSNLDKDLKILNGQVKT